MKPPPERSPKLALLYLFRDEATLLRYASCLQEEIFLSWSCIQT